jgi:putative MATE family efflux protein
MIIPLHEDLSPKQMRRVIYALAFPIVGTNLLLRGVGIVDTAMVGHISAQAQAAVGMSQWIIGFMMAIVQGVNVGGVISVARFTGSGDKDKRIASADSAFWMGVAAALLMTAASFLLVRPLSFAMGADEALSQRVASYMLIISLFFISKGLILVTSGIFQGFGDTKTPFRVIMGVNAIHLLIAFPLTFGMLGFPRLEIEGVALATGLSETLGAAFLIFLAYKKKLLCFRCFSFERIKSIVRLGLPVYGERIITTTMQMTYTRLVLLISVSAYAAHSVGMMIEAISFLPGFGFAQAATTLVGQNLGARLPHRAKEYGNQALLIALAVMGFLGLTYWFFPGIWMRIFSNDPEVIEYGILFCKFAAVIQIPLALTLILAGSLRGAGQTRWVMYSTLVGAWAIRVSIAYVFGWHFGLGIFFIWLAIPIDWSVRAVMLYLKYSSRKWSQGQ